ncbi:MAG: efflux RND transporter periplasmic adaptor subunit [Opitutaceae bacterium]
MSTKPDRSYFALKIGVVLLAVLGVGGYFAIASRPLAKVAVVNKGRAVNSVPGTVVIRAEYEQPLVSEIAGRIIEKDFNLDPGKQVKKGDVLCRIEITDTQIDIENIESEQDALKRRIEVGSLIELERQTARESLDQIERNYKLGSVSESDITKQRRAYKAVEIKVENDKINSQSALNGYINSLKVKRRIVEKMTIKAQFDGVVSAVFVHPGALINANTSLATLITVSRVVEAKISQENFAGIALGQSAIVRFLGHEDEIFEARTVKIMPTAEAETQRYIVHLEVAVKGRNELLVPGLTGEVSIVVGERDAQALVPRRAVFGSSIYLVEEGRVKRRKIELGYVSLNIVEVTKGLKSGELVIVDDIDKYREGDRVTTELVK